MWEQTSTLCVANIEKLTWGQIYNVQYGVCTTYLKKNLIDIQ